MNCKQAQRAILLLDSGEISRREAAALAEHVSACNACRAYRDDVQRLVTSAGPLLDAGAPAPAVTARILDRAQRPVPLPLMAWRQPFVRALAYAALLVALVGSWGRWSPDPRVNRITHMHAIVTVVADTEEEPAADGTDEKSAGLSELAERILMLEGFGEEGLPDVDLLIPEPEPEPTARQSRSTHVPATTARV